MYVIGIDPGLRTSGVVVLCSDKGVNKLVLAKEITSDNKHELSERLLYIYNEILKILETYNPEVLCVEESFVNINPKTSLKLNMVVGVILLLGAQRNIKTKIFSPNQIKKFITGNGFASKEIMGLFVKNLLNYETKSSHINDAIALSFLGIE